MGPNQRVLSNHLYFILLVFIIYTGLIHELSCSILFSLVKDIRLSGLHLPIRSLHGTYRQSNTTFVFVKTTYTSPSVFHKHWFYFLSLIPQYPLYQFNLSRSFIRVRLLKNISSTALTKKLIYTSRSWSDKF